MGSALSKKLKVQTGVVRPPISSITAPQPEPAVAIGEGEVIDGPSFEHPYKDPRARDDNFSFPLDESDLSSVSDEKLLEIFLTAPRLHHYGAVRIVRISKTLVIKGGGGVTLAEARNMIFAAETLHLQVPKVHRAFGASIPDSWGDPVQSHFIVMDYVSGPTVEDCWDSLSQDERDSVAQQLASMIETMQSKPLNDLAPGPLGGNEGKAFEGPWFTDYGAGPFATLQDLEDWCNHKIDVCLRFQQISEDTPRFKFHDAVLTHQDIAARNLILDPRGKLWLIDWGCAGIYPRGFEQAAFSEQSWNDELNEMVLSKLSDRQEILTKQYRAIAYGLSTAALL
ncbi:Protein kinase-like domain protein [Pleurostoma richardsiae]|uniref:Protein kinase-like domain protein n=1 Tax=Pleurostoma richardsiae TaxID=41990 RepID=A0AA38VNM2_9PEZI|nr:Protein kinase-like domain protein [Pleurostoma richardsiae]